jgi:anaerobic magnesium-protoporphyrin IX monomethyl ester cyclase
LSTGSIRSLSRGIPCVESCVLIHMNHLLFSHSYFMRYDPKQWATAQPYPPLATIGAAALMREHGFEVSLFDTMFVERAEEVAPRLDSERPDFFVVYDDGFNYLTKMCLTNMRDAAFQMMQLARQRGCVVIVSSSDSTDHYQQYLEKGADFVLLGEGEQTLLELVTAIRDGQEEFEAIAGLAWRKNGVAGLGPGRHRELPKDLDAASWILFAKRQHDTRVSV